MVTVDRAHEIVESLTYKRRWEFILEPCGFPPDAIRFTIRHWALNSELWNLPAVEGDAAYEVPIICTKVWSKEQISYMREVAFMELIKQEIIRLELHEVDEWLRLDGKRYTEPHKRHP